jgi:hypothetical protein
MLFIAIYLAVPFTLHVVGFVPGMKRGEGRKRRQFFNGVVYFHVFYRKKKGEREKAYFFLISCPPSLSHGERWKVKQGERGGGVTWRVKYKHITLSVLITITLMHLYYSFNTHLIVSQFLLTLVRGNCEGIKCSMGSI